MASLNGPGDVVWISSQNREIVHPGMMTMVINGGRIPEMFLTPFPKNPYRLPYVLLITFQPITFISVYYSVFLCHIFWGHQEGSGSILSFGVDLDSHFTMFLETFT